jgi:hypothetical protein
MLSSEFQLWEAILPLYGERGLPHRLENREERRERNGLPDVLKRNEKGACGRTGKGI